MFRVPPTTSFGGWISTLLWQETRMARGSISGQTQCVSDALVRQWMFLAIALISLHLYMHCRKACQKQTQGWGGGISFRTQKARSKQGKTSRGPTRYPSQKEYKQDILTEPSYGRFRKWTPNTVGFSFGFPLKPSKNRYAQKMAAQVIPWKSNIGACKGVPVTRESIKGEKPRGPSLSLGNNP